MPTKFSGSARALAISLGLSSPIVSSSLHAQELISGVNSRVSEVLSGVCIPEIQDMSVYSELYTIQDGDTFSALASERSIPYGDFIAYIAELNPEREVNINSIRIGDEYRILRADVPRFLLEQNREAISKAQEYSEIQALWESGDLEALESRLGFELTPSLPQSLGVRRSYETLASMLRQGYRVGPRASLPRLENTAVCKHVLSQTLTRFIGYNPDGILADIDALMTRQDTPAWILPGVLEDEGGYTRHPSLDLREFFRVSGFLSHRDAIYNRDEDLYNQGLRRQLEFLRSEDAVGCFIPTLYHGTNYAEIAYSESGGRDPNSHIFSCAGFSYSEDINVEEYGFKQGLESDFKPVLISMVRDLGGISRYQYASESQVLQGLSEIHEYILIQLILENGSTLTLTFNEDLEIENLSDIDISQVVGFRFGGNVLTDGFQITPTGNTIIDERGRRKQERLIEQRLNVDWVVYASHFFNTFHPTSILSAPPEFLDAYNNDIAGNYASKVGIRRFLDITGEEVASGYGGPSNMYINEISLEVLGVPYSEVIDIEARLRLERIYRAHSLGLQILGYHTFTGTDWTPGSTNINAPIPFLDIFTDEDIVSIEGVYAEFIEEKRQEYFQLIETICGDGSHNFYDFFYMKVFPGDTSMDLWTTLIRYVQTRDTLLATSMESLVEPQRLRLMSAIFDDELLQGNLSAGASIFLDANTTMQSIHSSLSDDFVGNNFISRLSETDRTIVTALTPNSQLQQSLAFFLIKEGYVPDTYYRLDDGSYADMIENFLSRLKRKDQKRYYAWMSENGYLEQNQRFLVWLNENKGYLSDEYPYVLGFIESLESVLSEVPSSGPNSWGDLQMRFSNLLSPELALSRWPNSDQLEEALSLITNPSGGLIQVLEDYKTEFPVQYERDMTVIDQILRELQSEAPDGEIVYRLLTSLLHLNDDSNRYLLGKILLLSLNRDLYAETLENICEQMLRVGESCNNMSVDEFERLLSYSYLAMNKGTGTALSIVTENYLLRVFLSLSTIYPDIGIPQTEIRRGEGITPKPVLNYFEFRGRVEGYIHHYAPYASEYPEIQSLINALELFLGSDSDVSVKHYTLLSNTILEDILKGADSDTSMLPTIEETNTPNGPRASFFSYNADRHIQDFIPERVQKRSDFLAPFLLFMLYGQTLGAMFAGSVSLVGRKTFGIMEEIITQIADDSLKLMRSTMQKYKKSKKRKGLLQSVRKGRKKYLQSILLTNDQRNPYKSHLYEDGEYIIDTHKGIFEKRGEDKLVLSSNPENIFANRAYEKYEGKSIKISGDISVEEIEESKLSESVLEIRKKQILILSSDDMVKIAAE